MHFSNIVLAVLPVLALAQSSSSDTSITSVTATRTHTWTKTVTLAFASTAAANASASRTTGITVPTSNGFSNSTLPTQPPHNAGASLEATKVALAGVAGMLVVAML